MKQKLLVLSGLLLMSLTSSAQIVFIKNVIDASTGTEPYAIASGHLNSDSYLDLAIGTYNSSQVTWYSNNGDGTFATGITLTATGPAALSYIESIAIGDLNNDGYNDIIATGSYNDNLVWFENNGDGTFNPAVLIATGIAGAGAVKVANIDNDPNGNLDIIVTAYSSNSVVYFLGNGDGTFIDDSFGIMRTLAVGASSSGPASLDIADYDGDGDLDVVVGYTGNGDVKLYKNMLIEEGGLDINGDVPFEPYTNTVDSSNGWLWSVVFGDVNNDGNLDIIRSDNNPGTNHNIAWFSSNTYDAGTAVFTKTTIPTSIKRTAAISIADLDNDGYNDLVVGNGRTTDKDLIVFPGNISGGLGSEIVLDDTTSTIFSMVIQDFDNDGDLDIAAISYLQDDLVIFINDLPTIGIAEFDNISLGIYPNPVKNNLYFKDLASEAQTVSVYNILGKEVLSATLYSNKALDVSKLSNGVYILKFKDTNTSYKFIKE